MKRDLDLIRQLLIDIENQGTDCAPSFLRETLSDQTDDRIRYHLRLMIDAGLVKEVERTMNGAACVRLSHAGHEMIELAQIETRWQEAKWVTREQTGGESLTVLKAILTKWAAEEATHGEVRRTSTEYLPVSQLPLRRPYYHRVEPRYRVDSRYRGRSMDSRYVDPRYYENRPTTVERTTPSEEELRLVQTRPDYLERFDWRNRAERERFGRNWYAYDSAGANSYSQSAYYADSPYYTKASYTRTPYANAEYYRERATADEIGISLPIHVV